MGAGEREFAVAGAFLGEVPGLGAVRRAEVAGRECLVADGFMETVIAGVSAGRPRLGDGWHRAAVLEWAGANPGDVRADEVTVEFGGAGAAEVRHRMGVCVLEEA